MCKARPLIQLVLSLTDLFQRHSFACVLPVSRGVVATSISESFVVTSAALNCRQRVRYGDSVRCLVAYSTNPAASDWCAERKTKLPGMSWSRFR